MDRLRTSFLQGYVKAVWQSIQDGANVIGYTVWSLFDNLAWIFAYQGRFGMDYEDELKRIPKDSYYWYQNVISNNGVSSSEVE